MEKMKAAVFHGYHNIQVEDISCPKLGPRDVLIRVKACGICGTDVHIFNGDEGAAAVTPPTVLGHEFSGVVEEVGTAVHTVKIGDRVCVDPNCYCGTCEPCRTGNVHFCEHMIGYGTTVNGGFAEYCAVDERQIYRLQDHVSFEQGAMTEPVACCVHGIDLCHIKPGSSVLIIGGGMIGMLMLQLAKLSGASKIALIEPVRRKHELAKKLGADLCITPDSGNIKEQLQSLGMRNIQTVIECVGRPETMEQAIKLAGYKAVVMMFGLTKPDQEVRLKPFEVFKKELELTASYINPLTQQRALELITSGKIDVESMIAERIKLEELAEVLSTSSRRADGKVVVLI